MALRKELPSLTPRVIVNDSSSRIYGPRKSVSIKFANRNSANFPDPPIFSGPFLLEEFGRPPACAGAPIKTNMRSNVNAEGKTE